MSAYDIVIKGGMIIDGARMPRWRGDIAIKDGQIAKMGGIPAAHGERVLDATDCFVVPGFVDLHTHYDAQVFWDPYCTISGWHGVTSVAIGNCGFGFAPVAPDERERAMLTMTRVEAIPLESMKAGLPWDWVTYPEFLDSLDRTPKAVNVLPYVPLGPLLVWVLGREDAKAGRSPTAAEMAELKRLLNEALDAGASGWSAQRLPERGGYSNQRDFDGTAMPTDNMSNETAIELARVLGERNEGFMQMSYATGDPKADGAHFAELAEVSGRPILYNTVQTNDFNPRQHRGQLRWLEKCRKQGLKVYGQSQTAAVSFTFTFEDWNLFDEVDAWAEATVGTVEERRQKLADPARRAKLRERAPVITLGPLEHIIVLRCEDQTLKPYENMTIGELAEKQGLDPVDAMLDLAVADRLRTTFYSESLSVSLEYISEIARYPWSLFGVSDGGAHTKFFTGGRYTTEAIICFGRDNDILELEDIHWHLSALPAYCAGFRDRGVLREGAPADIVIYDLDELRVEEEEVAHDFPGGEWRRVRRARGYRYILVNGQVTQVDGAHTGTHSGRLLRHGG